MVEPIRAVYHDGQLRLFDPVDLVDGQVLQLMIVTEKDRAKAASRSLLVNEGEAPSQEWNNAVETALLAEIEAGFRGHPSLSQAIIDERDGGL